MADNGSQVTCGAIVLAATETESNRRGRRFIFFRLGFSRSPVSAGDRASAPRPRQQMQQPPVQQAANGRRLLEEGEVFLEDAQRVRQLPAAGHDIMSPTACVSRLWLHRFLCWAARPCDLTAGPTAAPMM
ncbi:hypothetical protein BS78_05G211100 [Paspalum vaginatum]|nr:hypothetical protein BS78_05G211100 [Paspalum vaginatum]